MTRNPEKRLKAHKREPVKGAEDLGHPYMELLATSLSKSEAEQLEAYYIESLNSHNGQGGEGFNKARMYDWSSKVRKSRYLT
jgi:hypothetical protein